MDHLLKRIEVKIRLPIEINVAEQADEGRQLLYKPYDWAAPSSSATRPVTGVDELKSTSLAIGWRLRLAESPVTGLAVAGTFAGAICAILRPNAF
jgi:hypothetical protein